MRALARGWPIVVALTLAVGLARLEAAPAAGGIVVTPARVEAVIDTEGTVPPLTVHNRMARPIQIELAVGWGSHDLYGVPIYSETLPQPDVVVHVEPSQVVLLPGTQSNIRVQVEPANRPLYPVLFITWQPDEAGRSSSSGLATVTRIAVPFLLLPESHFSGNLRILDSKVAMLASGTVGITAVVANEGSAHVRAAGDVVVRNELKEIVSVLPLPEEVVLPGAKRLLEVIWQPAESPQGLYTISFDGDFGAEVPELGFRLQHDG